MVDQYFLGLGAKPSAGASGSGATAIMIANSSYVHALASGSQVVAVPGMTATSKVFLQIAGNDATFLSAQVVAAANQFTTFANTSPTGNTTVNYQVYQ